METDRLLYQVTAIVQLDRQHREERRRRGEFFNVFEILGLSTHETRTHSAFLAELLNPKGSHGLGDKFLRAFLQSMDCLKDFGMESRSAEVRVEEHIGFKNEECSEGGRIDIVVKSGSKAIIIENKIYAGDQEKQLVRYANYGAGKYSDYRLLYLTLFGSQASDSSCCDLKAGESYFPVGYDGAILRWLERCVELSARHPLVRETILQYNNLIKKLTYRNMETKYSEKIVDSMMRSENVEAVAAMFNLEQEWENRIVREHFIKPMSEFAKAQGLEFGFDEKKLFDREGDIGFHFHKPAWKYAAIWIYTECRNWKDFYCGISNYNGGALQVSKHRLQCLAKTPNDYWPYGWELLSQYKDWNHNTMPDMLKGAVANLCKE